MKKDGPFIKKKQPDGSIKKVGVKVIPAEKPQKKMEVPKPKPKKFKIIKLEPVNSPKPKPKPKKFKIIKLEPKKAPITNYLDMLPVGIKDNINKQVPMLKNLDIHRAYMKDIKEEKDALENPMYEAVSNAFPKWKNTSRQSRRNQIQKAMSEDKSIEFDNFVWGGLMDGFDHTINQKSARGNNYRKYYKNLMQINMNLERLKNKDLSEDKIKELKNKNKGLRASNTKWLKIIPEPWF